MLITQEGWQYASLWKFMTITTSVRRTGKHVAAALVLLLVILASGTMGALSEASRKSPEASDAVVYKRLDKTAAPAAPERLLSTLTTAAQPAAIPAPPAADETPRRAAYPQRREWSCRLPEGCADIEAIEAETLAQTMPSAADLTSLQQTQEAETPAWRKRYEWYQLLITTASEPLLEVATAPTDADKPALRLLHGRADVQANAALIQAEGRAYPEIPPVLVAAAIAEQASDVERIFGMDTLEKAALELPGLENMSIGIAQLRPTEIEGLGLGEADPFEPETAVQGMYAKIDLGNRRITELEDPAAPLSLTERYMVLSLAQNGTCEVDEYFALGGDWTTILLQDNNARVMRYFLVHLDWLLLNGWELPGDVNLDYWRELVFSSP